MRCLQGDVSSVEELRQPMSFTVRELVLELDPEVVCELSTETQAPEAEL
jgi:hypothetical protein